MRRPQSQFHQNLNRSRFISRFQVFYCEQEVQVEVQVDRQQGVYVDCKQHIQVDMLIVKKFRLIVN